MGWLILALCTSPVVRRCQTQRDEYTAKMGGERTHGHRCDRCGHYWRHSDSNAGNTRAHTCQRCGAEQWERTA